MRLTSNKTSAWRLFKFRSKAQTKAVRPVTALTIGGDPPYEVVNTVAVSEMSRAFFVRHFERHQSCYHDKRIYFSDVREKMVPGGCIGSLKVYQLNALI